VTIWKKHGITYDHVYDSNASSLGIQQDLYRIEDELLPVFHARPHQAPPLEEKHAS